MAIENFPPIRGISFGSKIVVPTSIVIPQVPLSQLSLSANQFMSGSSQGTVIGTVLGLSSNSNLILVDSHSGSVQLVAGVIQVGPTPPGVVGAFNINLMEALSGAVNTPNITTIIINEVASIPTINTLASIPGTVYVGSAITAIDAIWNNGVTSLAYQWQVAGVNGTGAGATSLTYTPAIGDLGSTLTLTVTATNSGGTSTPSISAPSTAVQAAQVFESTTYVSLLAA